MIIRESTWISPKNPQRDYRLRPTYLLRLYDEVQVFCKNKTKEKKEKEGGGEREGDGEGEGESREHTVVIAFKQSQLKISCLLEVT